MNTIDEVLAGFRDDAPAARADHAREVVSAALRSTTRSPAWGGGRRKWLATAFAAMGVGLMAALVMMFLRSDRRQHQPATDRLRTGWGLQVDVRVAPLDAHANLRALTQQAVEALLQRWKARGLTELGVEVIGDGRLRVTAPRAKRTSQLADLLRTYDRRIYDADRALFTSTDPHAVAAWLRLQPADDSGTRWTVFPPLSYRSPWRGTIPSTIDEVSARRIASPDSDVATSPASMRVIALHPPFPSSTDAPVHYFVVKDGDALVAGDDIGPPQQDRRDVLVGLSSHGGEAIRSWRGASARPRLLLATVDGGATYGPLTPTATANRFRVLRPGVSEIPMPGLVSADFLVSRSSQYGEQPPFRVSDTANPPALPPLPTTMTQLTSQVADGGVLQRREVLSVNADGATWKLIAARSASGADYALIASNHKDPVTVSARCDEGLGGAHTVTCVRTVIGAPSNPAVLLGRTTPPVASAVLVGRDGSTTPATVKDGWWAAVGQSRSLGDWKELVTKSGDGTTLETISLDGPIEADLGR